MSTRNLPSIEQFKMIAQLNKKNFDCLGHSQNYLAKKYGFENFNAIKPKLKSQKNDFFIKLFNRI